MSDSKDRQGRRQLRGLSASGALLFYFIIVAVLGIVIGVTAAARLLAGH